MTTNSEYETLEQVIKTDQKQEEMRYFVDEVGEYTVQGVGQWKGGLCSCFNNIYPSMFCSFFAPFLYTSLLYSELTKSRSNLYKCLAVFTSLNCLGFYFNFFTHNPSASYTIFMLGDVAILVLATKVRTGIRNVKKIPGSECEDLLVTLFCTSCSLAQSGRTLLEHEKICECV